MLTHLSSPRASHAIAKCYFGLGAAAVAATVALALMLPVQQANATPAFAKKTGESCGFCHTRDSIMSGDYILNRQGRDLKSNDYKLETRDKEDDAPPPARRPSSSAARQPEWCDSQDKQNRTERTICGSQELWELDNRLNGYYRQALHNGDTTQSAQRDWVRVTRNGCGGDEECLIDVYRRRINAIRPLGN